MADIVIVMDKGRVQQVGAPMEIYRDPANVFVAGFIGASNILPCRLLDASIVEVSGHHVTLTPDDRVKAPLGPALLSVRPEDVRLAPEGLSARVTFIRDLGERIELVLDHNGREVTALFSPRERPQVRIGDTVAFTFAPGGRVVLAP